MPDAEKMQDETGKFEKYFSEGTWYWRLSWLLVLHLFDGIGQLIDFSDKLRYWNTCYKS